MERCFRSCRPVPTLFCKGRNFLRMPRIIMDDELSTSEPSSDRPIIRLYIPHNQIILENSSFANMLLERMWEPVISVIILKLVLPLPITNRVFQFRFQRLKLEPNQGASRKDIRRSKPLEAIVRFTLLCFSSSFSHKLILCPSHWQIFAGQQSSWNKTGIVFRSDAVGVAVPGGQ